MFEIALQVAALSEVGRVRQNNEDAFTVTDATSGHRLDVEAGPWRIPVGPRGVLLALSDGMGGPRGRRGCQCPGDRSTAGRSRDQQAGQVGGVKPTKTGKPRLVDVSAPLANILLSATITAATENRPFPLAPGLPAEPTGPQCGKAYKLAARAMHRALTKAGIRSAELSLHSLRHSYAVALISAGVSPAYVQQQLGHADIRLTVNVYGNHFPAVVPGAVDALAAAFGRRDGQQMDSRASANPSPVAVEAA
jgi:hypothetical protein